MTNVKYKQPDKKDIKRICTENEDEAQYLPNNGSKFYEVKSFENAVKLIAHLRFHNREYLLLFRGHRQLVTNNGKYSFLPSIYRDLQGELEYQQRKEKLKKALELLQKQKRIKKYIDSLHLNTEEEKYIFYSIIQHYEITPTPLLDMTQSLQVAYTFSVLKPPENDKKITRSESYIAIFAFQPTDKNNFLIDNTVTISLMHYCPPGILRPYFQEAYSVGYTNSSINIDAMEQYKNLVAIIKVKNDKTLLCQNKYRYSKKYLQLTRHPRYITETKKQLNQYVLE